MPWMIEKRKSKYHVFKKGMDGKPEGNSLGEHDTKDEAKKQLAALYASESQPEGKTIPDDGLVAWGGTVKSLGLEQDSEGHQFGRIGGYLVLFGNEYAKDLVGDFFVQDTYYGPRNGDGADTMVHHGRPFKTGDPDVDDEFKTLSQRLLRPLKTQKDTLGIWAETVLDLSDDYERKVYELSQQGAFKWSSGTAPHMVIREASGKIVRWPIIEGSLTPTPAEPRMLSQRVLPLKSLLDGSIPQDENAPSGASAKGAPVKGSAASKSSVTDSENGGTAMTATKMDPMVAIQKLVPQLNAKQRSALAVVLELIGVPGVGEAAAPAEDEFMGMDEDMPADEEAAPEPEVDPTLEDDEAAAEDEFADDEFEEEDDEDEEDEYMTKRSISPEALAETLEALKAAGFEVKAPQSDDEPVARPGYDFKPAKKSNGDDEPEKGHSTKAFHAAYVTRFGDDDAAKTAIMDDLIGAQHRQVIWDQNAAFAKYMRFGEGVLDREQVKLLKTQIFPTKHIEALIADGMSVAEVKATMMESQGTLGGYAVPPNVQNNIVSRMPGLTAVRGNGATIITLSNTNSTELPRFTGGDDRYVGAIRGAWGAETATPGEKNATLDLVSTPAHVYTFKVPFSQSLVEDASNLVTLIQRQIADVMAMDEDEAFLIGDGVGKPLGILPGGANGHALTEVNSGAAAALTADGLKTLKRGIATQYRNGAVWIGNSDTFGEVERLKDLENRYLFEDLSETDRLLNRRVLESEAMPDVAAGAFPIIFGDLSAYYIVERLGLTIVRFQDSNTGINKVEYHVRKRVGGRPVENWKLAVQKVSA